jgi:hypothetical protein
LWELNGLLGVDDCSYIDGTAASTEYQALSGCSTPIPVETDGGAGTACGHWDELCYQGELMTGTATGGFEISRATVGTLEDMGYVVDYCQADAFPVENLDASCVCPAMSIQAEQAEVKGELNNFSEAGTNEGSNGRRRRRKLSDDGRKTAFEYGRQYLKSQSRKREEYVADEEGIIFVGDQYVIILFLEEGEVYGVHVTSHDL